MLFKAVRILTDKIRVKTDFLSSAINAENRVILNEDVDLLFATCVRPKVTFKKTAQNFPKDQVPHTHEICRETNNRVAFWSN
jgi:hypothetical protein